MGRRPTRRSTQRDKILEYLRSTTSHPTAQAIYQNILPQLPSLSLGTVYRNLNILEELGLVRRLQFGSTFDRYDAETDFHSHFFCRVCDRIYDIPVHDERELMHHVTEHSNHRVETYTLDFYGECEHCLADGADTE